MGAKLIAEALAMNTTLHDVDLSWNQIKGTFKWFYIILYIIMVVIIKWFTNP